MSKGYVPGLFGTSHGALQFMAYEELKRDYNKYKKVPSEAKLVSHLTLRVTISLETFSLFNKTQPQNLEVFSLITMNPQLISFSERSDSSVFLLCSAHFSHSPSVSVLTERIGIYRNGSIIQNICCGYNIPISGGASSTARPAQ